MMSTLNRNRSMTRVMAAVLAAVMPFTAYAANVSPVTAKFDVTMSVVPDCTVTAAPIDFGQTGLITATINGQANLTVTCTNTTPYNVGLDAGTGTGSAGTTRYMKGEKASNTDTVKFNLYRSLGSGLWGNTSGSDTLAGTGNGDKQTVTVYGEIPVQNAPTPDNYKSSITASVYF